MARKKYMSPMAFAGILEFQEYSNGWKVKPRTVIYFTLLVALVEILLFLLVGRP